MTVTQFEVLQAGPFVSYQDSGRPGNMRYGVAASGPMDRLSHRAANLAINNDEKATAVEISMGGLSIKCLLGTISLAVVGDGFTVLCDGKAASANQIITVKEGTTLTIQPGKSGSWCYLAFAGSVSAPMWLSHTATHSTSGFGGGFLKTGDRIEVNHSRVETGGKSRIPPFRKKPFGGYFRLVLGPQGQHFSSDAKRLLLTSEFTFSTAYDRMGVRLDGPTLALKGALSIPSEPIIKGSVQVSGEGVPTVLLADHQTTGGYPKIATMISSDLDQFVQLRPRDKFRFSAVTPENAVKLARLQNIEERTYLESIARL